MSLKAKIERQKDPELLTKELFDHVGDNLQRIESHLESVTPTDMAALATLSVQALGYISHSHDQLDNPTADPTKGKKAKAAAVKSVRQLLAAVRADLENTSPDICKSFLSTVADIDFSDALDVLMTKRRKYLLEKQQEEAEQGYKDDVRATEGDDAEL